MPANKKYLSAPGQRVLKITAAFVGGYLVTLSFHQLLMRLFDAKIIAVTAFFSTYLLWCALVILSFLSKNGWKTWLWYILLTLLFAVPVFYK